MQSQHWRHKAITWLNVYPELCRHMPYLGHDMLKAEQTEKGLMTMIDILDNLEFGLMLCDHETQGMWG